jgi:hypothetical protein
MEGGIQHTFLNVLAIGICKGGWNRVVWLDNYQLSHIEEASATPAKPKSWKSWGDYQRPYILGFDLTYLISFRFQDDIRFRVFTLWVLGGLLITWDLNLWRLHWTPFSVFILSRYYSMSADTCLSEDNSVPLVFFCCFQELPQCLKSPLFALFISQVLPLSLRKSSFIRRF